MSLWLKISLGELADMCLCLHVDFCLIQQETTSPASAVLRGPRTREGSFQGGPVPLRGADMMRIPVTPAQA